MKRAYAVLRELAGVLVSRNKPERLRDGLLRLGGLWVKVGQGLSTRYDLLPVRYCEALRSLQGRKEGNASTATIGSVKRSTMNGRVVAIKTILPSVRAQYDSDFRLMGRMAWCLDRVTRRAHAQDMLDELQSVIAEETDLRVEASHLKRMRPLLKKHGLHVPRVYIQKSTADRLVMEWVDGEPMTDILVRKDRRKFLRLQGLTEKHVAETILTSLKRQVMEANRFHGDMHPGNLMVSRGRIYVVDFGATHATDKGFLDTFTTFVRTVAGTDFYRAADLFCLLCVWPRQSLIRRGRNWVIGDPGMPAVRRRLVRALTAWASRAEVKALPFDEKSINRLSIDLMTIVMQAHGAMQSGWLRLTRAFSTVEGTVGVLWPSLNYVKQLRRYLKRAAKRERLQHISPVGIVNILLRLLDRLDEYGRIETASLRLEGVAEGL